MRITSEWQSKDNPPTLPGWYECRYISSGRIFWRYYDISKGYWMMLEDHNQEYIEHYNIKYITEATLTRELVRSTFGSFKANEWRGIIDG